MHEDQLYGVVVYKTKLLSSVRKIISTDIGMLVLIIIPILVIIAVFLFKPFMPQIIEWIKGLF